MYINKKWKFRTSLKKNKIKKIDIPIEKVENFNIILYRSSIWIDPYYWSSKYHSRWTCLNLDRTFSVWNFATRNMERAIDIYDFDKKILKIPIGFGLDEVLSFVENHVEWNGDVKELIPNGINFIDKRKDYVKPIHVEFEMKADIRDEYQKDAINFLLNIKSHNKLLSLGTGYGKTFCAIYCICKKQVPAIIISANLSKQWIERIKEYTKVTDKEIVEVRGMKSIENILNSEPNKDIPFFVSSTTTLNMYVNQGGNLDKLFQKMGVGIKVFDEAHTFYSQNAKLDVNSNTEETYYLTATPQRSNSEERKVFDRIFKHVPIHGMHTHYINKHYIIRVVNYNTYPKSNDVLACLRTSNKFFSPIAYSQYIFGNKEKSFFYMGMIKYFVDQLMKEEDMKIVIILPLLEHINIIQNFLSSFNNARYRVSQYTSAIDIEKRESQLEADVILSTLNSLKEGRDVKGLRAIFCLTSFSSTLIAQQLLGRLRPIEGKNTYYYDFADVGFPKMKKQRDSRKNEFLMRKQNVQLKNITQDEVFEYMKGQI